MRLYGEFEFTFIRLFLKSLRADPGSFRLQVFTLIRSLPLLEDVHLRGQGAENNDDSPIFRPSALPLLIGTLTISLARGTLELAARQLLDLPNGIRFREFWCTVHTKEDVRWMATLVEACSGTLEHIDIKDLTWGKLPPFSLRCAIDSRIDVMSALEESWAGSIDFSKATKLKGLTFRSFNRSVKWITMALKAITAHHRDLREVTIHVHFPPSGDCDNLRQIAGGRGFRRWIDLNSVLTRLMESHAVCVKTIHYPTGGDDLVREFMKEMFPAISTERGWSPRVRFADFDWEM